ncbi:hypothetical protein HA466_0183160 [Hirschfeldia incana]|nr:hypothetical protein HA466_0183160 [Hirschfeldia incana]
MEEQIINSATEESDETSLSGGVKIAGVVEEPLPKPPSEGHTPYIRSTGFPPYTGKPSLRFLTHRLDRNKKLRIQSTPPPTLRPETTENSHLEFPQSLQGQLGSAVEAQESFFKIKSRIRWLREGDSNTKFFHRVILANQSWNAIRYLRDSSGLRIYNQQQIKGMTGAYFKNLLGSESRGIEPMTIDAIRTLHPFRCSSTLALELTLIPSDDEIKAVFFKMPKSKAPGPDGFPAEFFMDAWEIVGITASFWHENWTSLGSLYQLTEGRGPRLTGLPVDAVVRDALQGGNWWLHSSRSRNPVISLIRNCLPDHSGILDSEEDDCFKWRIGSNPPAPFSNSLMWHHLFDQLPEQGSLGGFLLSLSTISSPLVYGCSTVAKVSF